VSQVGAGRLRQSKQHPKCKAQFCREQASVEVKDVLLHLPGDCTGGVAYWGGRVRSAGQVSFWTIMMSKQCHSHVSYRQMFNGGTACRPSQAAHPQDNPFQAVCPTSFVRATPAVYTDRCPGLNSLVTALGDEMPIHAPHLWVPGCSRCGRAASACARWQGMRDLSCAWRCCQGEMSCLAQVRLVCLQKAKSEDLAHGSGHVCCCCTHTKFWVSAGPVWQTCISLLQPCVLHTIQ
jgi:hypothetical protein